MSRRQGELFQIIVGFFAIVGLIAACSQQGTSEAAPADLPYAQVDAYVSTWRDPLTGCEYLKLYTGDLEPRWEFNNNSNSSYHAHRGCRP